MQFEGLTEEHLDNYRAPRSRSNVYSRQRLEIKEWLTSLSVPLLERLRSQGHSLDLLASDHHPSLWNKKNVDRQWIFFSRGKQAREKLERLVDQERSLASTLMDPTPYFKSSFLCITLSGDGFEAAAKLHHEAWVDRDEFLARMGDEEQSEAFLELITNLPEEYVMGVEGGPSHPVAEMDPGKLQSLIQHFESSKSMLSVGLRVDPKRTVELGQDLAEVAAVAFLLLTPVHEFLSWSEEQDWISLSDREEAIHQERQRISDRRRAEAEAYETRKRERQNEQQRRFEAQRPQMMDQQVYRERMKRSTVPVTPRDDRPREAADRPASPPRPVIPVSSGPSPSPRRDKGRPPGRHGRKRADTMPAVPFEVQPGVRVEVTQGVLAGKWGIVQEIDRRGQAKVVMGSLVARVPVDHLAPARPRRR